MPAAPTNHSGNAIRAARRHARTRRNLLVSLVGAIMLWAMLANTGGTYAMWSSGDSVDAGTILTGTVDLDATWESEHEAQAWQNLLPGDTAARSLTVTNAGPVSMELGASSASETSAITLRITGESCADDAADSPMLDEIVQAIPSADDPGAPMVLDAKEAAQLCVVASATESLKPGSEIGFAVTLEGRQIA